MAQSSPPTPPGSPPRNKAPSSGPPPMNEDFGDFEGDPTSINQIPNRDGQQRPSANNMHATPPGGPGQFAAASPSLSHVGPSPYGSNSQQMMPGQMTGQMGVPGQMTGMNQPMSLGPPMTQ